MYIFSSPTTQNIILLPLERESFSFSLEHGSHNVSRWMTWLPISLKNAAKCDKWYQLQNPSITESLNAKGAWEKLFTSHPRACHISQCRTKNLITSTHLSVCGCVRAKESPWRWMKHTQKDPRWCFKRGEEGLFLSPRVIQNKNHKKQRFFCVFLFLNFVHRPECGRTTRRT